MTRFLIGADADQVQSLIFRSSLLREVAGGSAVLKAFEDTLKESYPDEQIICDGGNIRLGFDSESEAKRALDVIAETYRSRTGGTMAAAGPERYDPSVQDDFARANSAVTRALALDKFRRVGAEMVEHTPFSALCASCGVELALEHGSPAPDAGEAPIYLCLTCREKSGIRPAGQSRMMKRLKQETDNLGHMSELRTSGDFVDDIGDMHPLGYVAHVVADVNGMGARFARCSTEGQASELSQQLERAAWIALAAPVPLIAASDRKYQKNRAVVAPLIVGGDDFYFLAPARFSLDVARCFVEAFEQETGGELHLGVAVVVCQYHYPYRLAYDHAHELLGKAKRFGKKRGCSAMSFGIIRGNQLPRLDSDKNPDRRFVPRAHPLPVGEESESSGTPTIANLIAARQQLDTLPQKRRVELGRAFDSTGLTRAGLDEKEWRRLLWRVIGRAEKMHTDQFRSVPALTSWFELEYEGKVDRPVKGHLLADLIEMWDYAESLERPKIGGE